MIQDANQQFQKAQEETCEEELGRVRRGDGRGAENIKGNGDENKIKILIWWGNHFVVSPGVQLPPSEMTA